MSNTLNLRKLHLYQEIFHINMIAIPFFYSQRPTNILVVRGFSEESINYSNGQIMKKLYYKNNKPIITTLLSFESVQKAIKFKEEIKNIASKENNKKFLCQFCKDISKFNGVLFKLGTNFVTYPETKEMKELIDAVSQLIVVDGAQIEECLKRMDKSILFFLNECILSLENNYYRWRVYSYLQGNGEKKYRTEPFQIVRNGTTWFPPLPSNQITYPSVLNMKKTVFLSQCLEKMQRRKYAIEQLMVFAFYNIDSAVQIASVIIVKLYEKLRQDFISIFYLISDILFNSTNHTYRNIFQSILPFIIYKYVLLKQNDEKKQMNDKYVTELKKLLSLWERKYIFDETFMKGVIFMLELIEIEKLYQLQRYPIHMKIEEIINSDYYFEQLEKYCIENGLPFFVTKQQQAKLFLNSLFWSNEKIQENQPETGKFDGEVINEKQLIKIQSKAYKIMICQDLPLSLMFEKNWKEMKHNQNSVSQDGYN